ncbi:MAG TPA: hypothetical protein PK718_06210 [Candidatus Methanofastidiosa archaeon]|mgnify:CR=1 FL=1|nr:hypothetical protein [Candidatus Methanofastidiosa archaeon]HPR42125.1 hypothetical protein [Candidatus Methanofastidiosa archaeon]
MDEVRRAILFVYSHMASYIVIVIAALTLFKIAFDLPVPLLGTLIFLSLLLMHLLIYYMLKAPLKEAGLMKYLYMMLLFYLVMMLLSITVFLGL